jgi:hypothetical protein
MHPLRSRVLAAARPLSIRLPYQPWSVLVPLVVVEWLGIAVEAHSRIPHNGWSFSSGRGETLYWTSGWLLGHGHLPHAIVGYGVPVLFAPVSWLAGASLLSALPFVVAVQVAVLVPLGAFGLYVLGARSGGRLIGYLAAAVWTLGPFVTTWYFKPFALWRPEVLPVLLGLTARPEWIAALVLVAAAVLVLRALDDARLADALCAGLLGGFALGIQPSNVLFLAAPVVAFAVARRPRELGVFALGLVPAVVTYAAWSGSLPLPHHDWSWAQFKLNWYYVLPASWSPRVLEWGALAGFVALLKRSPPKALFFGVWLGAYALAEGASTGLRAYHVAFWHLLVPALPAYAVLLGSLPFLWPRADRRLPERFPYVPARVVSLAFPAAVLALVPLVWAVVASPLHGRPAAVQIPGANALVPVRGPRAVRQHGVLSWQPVAPTHATTIYVVYRDLKEVGKTEKTSFRVEPGGAYRVGVRAKRGPLVLIGPAAS